MNERYITWEKAMNPGAKKMIKVKMILCEKIFRFNWEVKQQWQPWV